MMFQAKDGQIDQSVAAKTRPHRALSDTTLKRLFLWPTLALLITFNIFPLLYSLYVSFTEFSAISGKPPVWVGLQNYQSILNDPKMWLYFSNTGRFVLLTVSLQILIGFGMALLLRDKFRGSGLISTLILIPMMLSPVVVGVFWQVMYNPNYGIVNYALGFLPGQGPAWNTDRNFALWSVVIVDVWMWSPFVMLLCLAGLSSIPDYLYEAAEIDGAGPWGKFWNVTVPMMSPIIFYNLIVGFIASLQGFVLVLIMTTDGRPANAALMIGLYLYRQAFVFFNVGYASAIAWVLLMVIMLFTGAQFYFAKYWVFYEGETRR
jgi:multiple sugar transport system permease protein